MKRTVQQERIANGLCPQCGGEAAPYYLCGKCRMLAKIGRVLRRAHGAGAVTKEMRGGKVYWRHASDEAWNSIAWRADPGEDDRRHRPRIRGVPVMDEKMGVAVEAAFRELQRQLPQALDLTDNRTEVLPFDGFDLRAVVTAAIEAYESAKAAQQWQPIETAPKDGTVVDLWIEAAGRVSFRAAGYRWSTKTGEFAWLDSIGSDPLEENFMNVGMRATHWTPIPKPPSAAQQPEMLTIPEIETKGRREL